MAITFALNGKSQSVDVHPQTPLLWVLRDTLGYTGTKFGCGMALCGACTVHVNGNATRACVTPIATFGPNRSRSRSTSSVRPPGGTPTSVAVPAYAHMRTASTSPCGA